MLWRNRSKNLLFAFNFTNGFLEHYEQFSECKQLIAQMKPFCCKSTIHGPLDPMNSPEKFNFRQFFPTDNFWIVH
jgi:hypothetical protein